MKIILYLLALLVFVIIPLNSFSFDNEKKRHICFRIIDSDKDGKITFEEFDKYFKNDLELFKAIDLNKDGTLSHDEYHKSIGHGSMK